MATSRVFSIQQYLSFMLSDSCEKCGVNGSVVWIQIRIRIRKAKIINKKVKKFHVLKCWMFSFEG
jgi:hypothetical protein